MIELRNLRAKELMLPQGNAGKKLIVTSLIPVLFFTYLRSEMSMEVEEDPSSQFVDFTNATALEHFISDLEQVLIAWRLSNKGHASPLTASVAPASSSSPNTQPLTWTRIVTFEPSGKGATALNCALTLFAPAPSTAWLTQRSSSRFGGKRCAQEQDQVAGRA